MRRPEHSFHGATGWHGSLPAICAGVVVSALHCLAADAPRPAEPISAVPSVAPAKTNIVSNPDAAAGAGTNAPSSAASRVEAGGTPPSSGGALGNSAPAGTPGTNSHTEAASEATPAPAAGPGSSYADFKLIGDRNIFNPNRTRRSSRGGSDAPKPKPTIVQTLSLVGIMSYGKGDLAFFDGSSASLRKVAHTNDTIAGGQVLGITPSQVRMKLEGKEVTLAVGARFRREDEGAWTLVEPGGKPAASESGASAPADGDAPKSEAGGEESDVLKRLMQKREQEMKNEKE
jgi:hypothetical protein